MPVRRTRPGVDGRSVGRDHAAIVAGSPDRRPPSISTVADAPASRTERQPPFAHVPGSGRPEMGTDGGRDREVHRPVAETPTLHAGHDRGPGRPTGTPVAAPNPPIMRPSPPTSPPSAPGPPETVPAASSAPDPARCHQVHRLGRRGLLARSIASLEGRAGGSPSGCSTRSRTGAGSSSNQRRAPAAALSIATVTNWLPRANHDQGEFETRPASMGQGGQAGSSPSPGASRLGSALSALLRRGSTPSPRPCAVDLVAR